MVVDGVDGVVVGVVDGAGVVVVDRTVFLLTH